MSERISDERLREKLYSAEIAEAAYRRNGLGVEAKIWSEDVSLLRELLSLRASHAELVKELEDHMWQPSHPASLFLLCRGCSSPQGKAHHKVCCINNALENARKMIK